MESDRAQLSALSTSLDDLSRRIAEIADKHRRPPREDIATGLDEVERSLTTASRRLAKVMRAMRS
jgi:hypothetical protein